MSAWAGECGKKGVCRAGLRHGLCLHAFSLFGPAFQSVSGLLLEMNHILLTYLSNCKNLSYYIKSLSVSVSFSLCLGVPLSLSVPLFSLSVPLFSLCVSFLSLSLSLI